MRCHSNQVSFVRCTWWHKMSHLSDQQRYLHFFHELQDVGFQKMYVSNCHPNWHRWPNSQSLTHELFMNINDCVTCWQVFTEMVRLTNENAWRVDRCSLRWFDWPMRMHCESTLMKTATCFFGSNIRHHKASSEPRSLTSLVFSVSGRPDTHEISCCACPTPQNVGLSCDLV